MVSLRSFDQHYGFTGGDREEKAARRGAPSVRRYLVTLTSDEEVTTEEVEWTADIAAAVSALAQAINAKAIWTASPRMQLDRLEPPPQDAA